VPESLLDRLIIFAGFAMIALTIYVAVISQPPIGEALRQTVFPSESISRPSPTSSVAPSAGTSPMPVHTACSTKA
jgi:Mn2+/Fe2+ NRAMP family transporter